MPQSKFKELQETAKKEILKLHPAGTPLIKVGSAVCGRAVGSSQALNSIKELLEGASVDATISEVGCMGLCYAEPIVDITTNTGLRLIMNNVTPEIVEESLLPLLNDGVIPDKNVLGWTGEIEIPKIPKFDDIPEWKHQTRIATRNCGFLEPGNIYEYIDAGGYAGLAKAIEKMSNKEVIDEVSASGLRGRGGAAFPTGTKWSFLAGSNKTDKYILCNCEEGDPGAYNDKAILESDPHTLIEGMIIAAYATKSNYGHVFIRHGHEGPIKRTRQAISEARKAGLLGQNILGSGFSFDLEVSLTGESYVSGEETALMDSIEGKRAMPRARPPFPAQAGLWGKPSNVNNVKTLAYIPEIISRGSDWFSSIGVGKSTGTAILCLSGDIERPGMYEVAMGMTLRQAIDEIAGGIANGSKLKFLQTGGPLGGVLSAEKSDTPLDFEAMREAGAILGSGGIIVASEKVCAVDVTRVLVTFCQFESCGKCFPCRKGFTHLQEIMIRISTNKGTQGDIDLMRNIGKAMTPGSLCGHGQLGFNPVESALQYFSDDFQSHIESKRCPTGSCNAYTLTPERTRS